MHIRWTVLVGLLAGVIAKFVFPGKETRGWVVTALLGIAGSFVASYLGQWLKFYKPGQTAGFIGAVAGALIILFFFNLFRKKSH